jgi:hypothetical protein
MLLLELQNAPSNVGKFSRGLHGPGGPRAGPGLVFATEKKGGPGRWHNGPGLGLPAGLIAIGPGRAWAGPGRR